MHKLQVKWADTQKVSEYSFQTHDEWMAQVNIAKFVNAQVRFWSETFSRWTRWA